MSELLNTADLSRLVDNAMTRLPGALQGAVQMEMFNVLNDFFQNTNIWTEDISLPVTTANTRYSTTTITVADDGVINRLMYVIDSNRQPRKVVMPQPGTLLFLESVGQNETWTVRVAKTVDDPIPSVGGTAGYPDAPAWILNKYNNGLLDGLLGRMMLQQAKPYSNPKLALMHTRSYNGTVSLARTEARHANLYAGQTWRFPGGFARGSQRGMGWSS